MSGLFRRKRHSTGMNSTRFAGTPGIVNDLTSSLNPRSEEDADFALSLALSAKKTLAAIRLKAQEDRVLLGARPCPKRKCKSQSVLKRAKKRSRKEFCFPYPFGPFAAAKNSAPVRQVRGLFPRVPFGKCCSLSRIQHNPVRIALEEFHRTKRDENPNSTDLNCQSSDDVSMESIQPVARKSLSPAAIDAIKDEVAAQVKEKFRTFLHDTLAQLDNWF